MQEIKKSRIVITSVLKPVDDTRMYEKIGLSLAAAGFDVHVIGYPSASPPADNVITVHSLRPFGRISVSRVASALKILRIVLRLKPDVLIITTHELLNAAWIAKVLTGCKVIYDIQENYFRNIVASKTFPLLLKEAVALHVRTKEIMISPMIDLFFLAEKAYAREIRFLPGRSVVLENKMKKASQRIVNRNDRGYNLVFSGTLAETTGVLIAIDLAEKLHDIEPEITLTIIGYCADETMLPEILRRVKGKPFIRVVGGDKLVPHREILTALQAADFGIIAYPKNASTENSIPTKLYEYLGAHLPILLADHPVWRSIAAPFPAAVTFDPTNVDAPTLLTTMRNTEFYQREPVNVYWDSEEEKLVQAVRGIVA